jgi:hypothetical protein
MYVYFGSDMWSGHGGSSWMAFKAGTQTEALASSLFMRKLRKLLEVRERRRIATGWSFRMIFDGIECTRVRIWD